MARVILNQNQSYVSDADDIITQIGNLSDVFITSAANGDILVYNDSLSRWENSPNSELTSLNALSDVSITSAANGQLLVYNNSTSEWENNGALIVDGPNNIVYATVEFMGVTTDGPTAELYVENNNDTPIAGDGCGSFRGYGKNDATNYVAYSSIETSMDDITDGSELGSLNLQVVDNGSLETKINISSNQVRLNVNSTTLNHVGTPYLFLQNSDPAIANNDILGSVIFTDPNNHEYADIAVELIDDSSGNEASGFRIFNSINGTFKPCFTIDGSFDEIQLTTLYVSQFYSDPGGPKFNLINETDPGVSGHTAGTFTFGGYSDTGSYQNYANIETLMDDTTDGAENAAMILRTVTNGTLEPKIEISASEINVSNAQVIINDKIKVNGAVYDDFTVVRSGSGNYAANIASDIDDDLADGDRSSFIGFEIQTNTDWAYPGLIGSEYNASGTSNGNKILLQVYDDGVTTFTRNTILEAAEERVVSYRPFKLAGYASTALPTGAQGGDMIAISDEDYKPAYFDGTDWLYVHDNSAV